MCTNLLLQFAKNVYLNELFEYIFLSLYMSHVMLGINKGNTGAKVDFSLFHTKYLSII